MNRIQEKVRDIVEVRAHKALRDFIADPAETVAAYYFTDGTADLMAKWLDRVAAVQPETGAAFALAGYRGVGKSHFLATLGALVSHPELRSRVLDPHVAAGAHRLSRKHYPVVYVRRGLRENLLAEFTAALDESLGTDSSGAEGSVTEILRGACEKAGDLPLVLLIDTAYDRGSRVARDDGPLLSEIAEAAKSLNVFLGVALDDDIASADGSNLGISRSFSIDYLDQEHLYKVVNTHVFPKLHHAQPTLSEIYSYFRDVIPSFRWSEPRFAALYPLHPAILEVAPFVRLYVPDFALLGFSSAAAERILGRPANSLIGLDEVFDNVEKALRKIQDLEEAFTAYDHLNAEVVGKIPIMRRLQAKLVLKALLLLSLDGQGTTAAEISAAMLIFDEEDPSRAVSVVDELIRSFAEELPDEIQIIADAERGDRYGFRISGKDGLNLALAEQIELVPDLVVQQVLRRMLNEKFPDSTLSAITDGINKDWMDSQLEWRGGTRRGRVFLIDDASEDLSEHAASPGLLMDWEVLIDLRTGDAPHFAASEGVSRVIWKPAELRKDESDAVRRYYVLNTATELRDQFGEQIRASVHSHAVRVGKIADRVLLEDGKLVIDGFDYNFTDDACSTHTLSDLFSVMLEPLFETRYPEHPAFARHLGMTEVASLTDLYDGSRRHLPDVQEIARSFALPMGLVTEEDGLLVPRSDESLATLPAAAEMLELVGNLKSGEPITLREIYEHFRKEPRGLVREAQHLLLTALVAQRRIDFVTSKGDRINQRSLDLQIIWDDIVGIARPAGPAFSAKKLTRWAALLARQNVSLDAESGREALKSALRSWLGDWHSAKVLKRFNELPDDILNSLVWGAASRCTRTLGATAENIKAALDGTIELEECLNRIADTFSDSDERFLVAQSELSVVESFIEGEPARSRALSYLSGCEVTDSDELEEMREQVFHLTDVGYSNPSGSGNRELGYLWTKFQRDFADHFAARHDAVMHSHALQGAYAEILQGDDWWEFENLSQLPFFDKSIADEVHRLRARFGELNCGFDVREGLRLRPFCRCSFSLANEKDWEKLPQTFASSIAKALRAYRVKLAADNKAVKKLVEAAVRNVDDKEIASEARVLLESFSSGKDIERFSLVQLQVLHTALGRKARGVVAPVSAGRDVAQFSPDVTEQSIPA